MLTPGQTWVYVTAEAPGEEAKVFVVAPTPTRTVASKRPRIITIRFNSFSGF